MNACWRNKNPLTQRKGHARGLGSRGPKSGGGGGSPIEPWQDHNHDTCMILLKAVLAYSRALPKKRFPVLEESCGKGHNPKIGENQKWKFRFFFHRKK